MNANKQDFFLHGRSLWRSLRLAQLRFASTAAFNEVLAREKQSMPAEERQRLEALEKAGLFGNGKP